MHPKSTAMAMILALMAAPELSRAIAGLVSGMKGAPIRDSSLSDDEIPAIAMTKLLYKDIRLSRVGPPAKSRTTGLGACDGCAISGLVMCLLPIGCERHRAGTAILAKFRRIWQELPSNRQTPEV